MAAGFGLSRNVDYSNSSYIHDFPSYNADYDSNAGNIAFAIIFMLLGLIMVFCGLKFFKSFILPLLGFYLFAVISVSILKSVEDHGTNFGSNRTLIFVLVPILCGIIGAAFFRAIFKFGVFIAGLILGFVIASFILHAVPSAANLESSVKIIIYVISCIACAAITFFFRDPVVVLATSLVGSMSFLGGVDFFVKSGFLEALHDAFVTRKINTHNQQEVYFFVAFPIITVIGCAWQMTESARRNRTLEEMYGVNNQNYGNGKA